MNSLLKYPKHLKFINEAVNSINEFSDKSKINIYIYI